MLYFDHNATHPLSDRARAAWLEAVDRYPGNPSSPHRLGARADHALGVARQKLADSLGCSADEVVWTSGATEANNAILHHASARGGEVWLSAIEHPCTLAAARRYFPGRHRLIPVDGDGVVVLDWLRNSLRERRPAVIAVMAANNETGVLQPWREILALCRDAGVDFFSDAAQWLGKLPAAGLGGVDFISGCAHKFGGPPGVGFLKAPAAFRPLLVGGPQEESRRAGTENLPGVLAMVAALEERTAVLTPAFVAERETWRSEFERELQARVPGTEILGGGAPRLWNTISVAMPELPDCRQRWVVKLDKLGCAVSTGSACASGKEETSHVLGAMGIAPATASRVLRVSSGWLTGPAEWQRLLEAMVAAARELASRS